jgi:hypothetical protein
MVTMDANLIVRLPAHVAEAVKDAAARELSNVSTYTRQALLARLLADGAITRDQLDRHDQGALGAYETGPKE